MSSKNKIDKETAIKIVKECYTIADFCRKVNWVPRGDNYKIFHKYEKEYNLDTSHFTGCKTNIGNRLNKHKELSVNEYITNNKIIRGSTLIKKLINEGIKECKCERCKNEEWEGDVIPLELHHINGNNMDNRIENVQLLCPNCHALTDNYRGKKNKKKFFCKNCGNEITKYSKSGYCNKCIKEQNKKHKIPSKELLIENFTKLSSFCKVAKVFNCSDNTIRKWCKKYGLPIHSKEIKNYIKSLNTVPDTMS